MKANELMVGDWVILGEPKEKRFVQVISTYLNEQMTKWMTPIPLTVEILEKNFSADKQWDNGWIINDNDLHIYQTTVGVYNIQYMEIVDIHYVHELQHSLKLCGIEKEIRL